MKTRIITGSIMVCLGVPLLIFAPEWAFIILACLLALIASYELIHMFEHKAESKMSFISKVTVYTVVAFTNIGISLPSYLNKFQGFSIDIPSILMICLLISMFVVGLLLVFDKTINSNEGCKILLIVSYVGIGFAAVPLLRMYSKGMLIYVILVACFTDIFAYFFGVAFGTKFIKKRPAPVISPKKSYEGCFFGTLFGTVFGTLVFIFYNELFADGGTLLENVCDVNNKTLEIIIAVFLTLGVSFIGQVGDLVASKLKRDNDIKDYGKIFPGHGGVLDRFDSTLFVCIFLEIIFVFLGVILPL